MSQASEFLRDRELVWAPALYAVSLVSELGAPENEVKEVIRALGQVCGDADPYDRRRLLAHRYPACLVTGLAGIGAIGYDHGNYWSAVHQLTPDRIDQHLWGEVFRANLDRFNLARFPGLPQINVGEILIHAGVPAYCIGDLLNLLLERLARDPSLSAEHFLAWALTPGRESRLSQLDKPVQRFIQHGGEYAEDLIDRCIDLLDRLRQPAFHADGLGLPPYLITKAQHLAEAGQIDWTGVIDRQPSGSRTQARPHLELEPFGRGLLVWLPPVPDAADGYVVWHVRIDGEAQTVVSRSMWPGVRETAPATALTIARPARQLTVELAAHDQEHEIEVVDPGDPLLVFTDDGRRVPATSSLPPEPVWLLYPHETDTGAPLELHVTGEGRDLGDVPAPYGWLGWTLRRIDLRHVSELRLGNGTTRRVKGARRAQLHLDSPVPGVSSLTGAPVVAAAPELTLPTDPGITTEWSIRIRRPGSGQLITEVVTVTRDTTIDPWRRLPRPLVGTYEVTVRGPLGRGLSRTLELVEGLNAGSNPSWREIRTEGLEPATVRASASLHGLIVTPAMVQLGPKDVTAEVQIHSRAGSATVRVTPAHMAIQRLGGNGRGAWSLQPLRLDSETIGEGELLVRLPEVADAQLVVKAVDRELQTVCSGATYGQPLARFALAAIADTVGVHGIAQLDVRVDGQDFPVARCTPRRLASSVHIDKGRLILVNGVHAEGLVAGLYRVYAPWQPPHVVTFNQDLVSDALPEEVTTAGPLVVLLRIEDPWVPAEWPDWPAADNAFDIADREWKPSGGDTADDAVSAYLAGAGDLPDRPDIAPLLIDLYHRADGLRGRVTCDVRGVSVILRRHPAHALTALAKTRTSADRLVAPLVHSGLIATPPDAYVEERDAPKLWGISPLAGMLATAHRLGEQDGNEELREQVSAVCGEVALHLLAGGIDPYRMVGRFDESALRLAELPMEGRDRLWKAIRVVPGGLLDADERLTAARQLFDVRIQPGLGRVSSAAKELLLVSRQQIHAAGGQRVTDAVQARKPTAGWQGLPALSLVLAFVARLAARRHNGCKRLLPRTLPHHATLARSAPRLVTIDLLLAEFTLIGSGAAR